MAASSSSLLLKLLSSQTPSPSLPHAFHSQLPASLKTTASPSPRSLLLCSASSSAHRDLAPSATRSHCKSPDSREEAISQAKLCLSSVLQKHLNNSPSLPTRKLKKPRQPRYRVEIPVVDSSPASLVPLALDVFSDLPLQKKKQGGKPRVLLLWPSPAAAESARQALGSVDHSDWDSVVSHTFASADLAVFLAPEVSRLREMRTAANALYPKPLVLFNPGWGFDEEKDFDREIEGFVGSFAVVYSFMGLEVRGVLSRRRGLVLKCARDGVVSGEEWMVMVEQEGEELKTVTSFKKRPSIVEVENVLYNLMAANSPVTKSVKFISDLVSNVTGRKASK
ncbi:uncharacterized protein LOC122013782 [Zingiber officinale]|uniref:DUF1995 domain-containing protein n=1 Tax=Zingiber officinale TaxID=94328 RepID=A0A8J5KKR9_ZINOF|nr:uncharacterized protein LOC122013782 [Zingiber officinale]KAG6480588.1 hypothetical protein ZIOFF_057172 [Zingiber officinale]